MKFALIFLFLLSPTFAAKLKCPSLDESDTAAYVRLLTHVSAKRSGLDALGAVAESATPMNPMGHFPTMREAEALGFRRAFDERLGSGKVDWQTVRNEAARILHEKQGRAARQEDAADKKHAIVNPKLLVPDLFKAARIDFGTPGFRMWGELGADGALYILPEAPFKETGYAFRYENGQTTAIPLPGNLTASRLALAPNGDVFAVGFTAEKTTVVNLRDGSTVENPTSKRLQTFLKDHAVDLRRGGNAIDADLRVLHAGDETIVVHTGDGVTAVERIGNGARWPKVPKGEFAIHRAADGRKLAYGWTPKGVEFFVRDLATGKDVLRRRLEREDGRYFRSWITEDPSGNVTVATSTILEGRTVVREFSLASGAERSITLEPEFRIGNGGYIRDAQGDTRLVLQKKDYSTDDAFQYAVIDVGSTTPRLIPGTHNAYDELMTFTTADYHTYLMGHAEGFWGNDLFTVDIDSGVRDKFTPAGLGEHQVTAIAKLPNGRVVGLGGRSAGQRLDTAIILQLYGPSK